MQSERAELYFQQGSSDKVYHLQLENVQDQWSVQVQWGRRGAALQSDVKVSGISYEEAKRVYDRILREKTGKGYGPTEVSVLRRQLAAQQWIVQTGKIGLRTSRRQSHG
jgi:bifunctional non-homologous end joining protein LigD